MKSQTRKNQRSRGFALVVTLSLMILLTVIAVGLLTLSSISLRSANAGQAEARAFANARLALILAIGELQKEAGDDRRITADASILEKASQPHLVGVWSSWSPDFAAKPDQGAPDYESRKTDLFSSWLASSPEPAALRDRAWAENEVPADWPRLFSANRDGFDLRAARVATPQGGFAWAVSQENTKTKINVAGPEPNADSALNPALQAQRRPSLELSPLLEQPKDGWNLRAGRVLSLAQVSLDPELATDPAAVAAAGASFTAHSQGLLTDPVRGGLKTDLNLGFEMSDSDFEKSTWGDTPNPFRAAGAKGGLSPPDSYNGQVPLFMPLVENPIVSITTNYSPAKVADRFYAAAIPTFDHLRAFYRIPHHLYGSGPPTVAGRGPDHVAIDIPAPSRGASFAPSNPPQGQGSSLAVRPVLNRVVYLLSARLDGNSRVQLALTPIISLWNPYNAALEIEGAVAYPWMDLPFQLDWKIISNGNTAYHSVNMSEAMGKQFESAGHGRSIDPFFLCELTANGDGNVSKPIRFEPGEVRVFTPSSATPIDFIRKSSAASRTVRMWPVDDISQMNTKGGLAIPMTDVVNNNGFNDVVKRSDKVQLKIREALAGKYNYFVSLEDAARIKNPADSTRGEVITDVQIFNLVSAVREVESPVWTQIELSTTPQPFAVLETFHRTALENVGEQPIADLVYTTNPRQAAMNHQLAAGSFKVAPHFQSTLRRVASFDGAIQTTSDGRRSFWGPSHSASGRDKLPFFEIPREPLLSLAAFQHADLSSSTFASANQFGNSWASPYLGRGKTAMVASTYAKPGVPVYDTPCLTNEALWDGFFFSGAVPDLKPAASGRPSSAWDSPIATVERDLNEVIADFVADPLNQPLANSRMRLNRGGLSEKALVDRLLDPAGCTRIAAHLTVDGAFNINSTDVEAWTAQLSGLRGETFLVEDGGPPDSNLTAFPRFRHPTGLTDDNWNGFRALSDGQLRTLAENLVREIRARGPFLSLAEFVNRRVEDSEFGNTGAIQAAIDAARLNEQSKQATFSAAKYPAEARDHIITDTGVGIPGYLTQADVLQSLAPIITCRSDTFTVRAYGEATDATGKVLARSWCEAIVQRTPEFVDPTDAPDAAIASLAPSNQTFGRRFEIISFRRVPSTEFQ